MLASDVQDAKPNPVNEMMLSVRRPRFELWLIAPAFQADVANAPDSTENGSPFR